MTTFSGGEALEKKLKEMAEKLGDGKTVSVGFLEGSEYPDGTSLPMVAAANEFGNPASGSPPRPFFRNMIAKNSPKWGDDIAAIATSVEFDAHKTFSLMGERIKDQLQESIRELTEPSLSPVTILLRERFGNNHHEITFDDVQKARDDVARGKKGSASDKPLIWTGHMLNSVDYEVKDGTE